MAMLVSGRVYNLGFFQGEIVTSEGLGRKPEVKIWMVTIPQRGATPKICHTFFPTIISANLSR